MRIIVFIYPATEETRRIEGGFVEVKGYGESVFVEGSRGGLMVWIQRGRGERSEGVKLG